MCAVTRESHARPVLAPAFRAVVSPTFERPVGPVAASTPEIRPQGAAVTAETRASKPAPAAPELPPLPSAGASAAPAGLAFAGFAALFGAVALLLAGAMRTLHLTPVAVRPAPFISLLERPG